MTVQYLELQAARAERLAKTILDKATHDALMGLASEYREQIARAGALSLLRWVPEGSALTDSTASPPF